MATFTSTLTESFTGDTGTIDSTNTLSISGIEEVTKFVVGVKNGVQTTLATFAAGAHTSAGAHKVGDVKYVRITNMGSANVSIGIIGAATCHNIILGADESYIIGATDDTYLAEADTDPSHASHADITSIEAQSTSGVQQVEIVIASA